MKYNKAWSFIEFYKKVVSGEFSLLPKYYEKEMNFKCEIPESLLKVDDQKTYNAVVLAWKDYVESIELD